MSTALEAEKPHVIAPADLMSGEEPLSGSQVTTFLLHSHMAEREDSSLFLFLQVKSLSRVRLFATPWSVAHQAPPSMGFPRQEYWSGSPFLFPGKLPDPGIEPIFPALARRFFTAEPLGKLNFFDSPFLFSVIVVHSLHCYKYSIW